MNSHDIDATDEVGIIIAGFAAQLADPTKPLALLVRFTVADGTQAAVEAAFAAASGDTAREAGVLTYQLLREAAEPTRFVVYEHWRSLADLEAHLRTPYITRLRDRFTRLIIGEPEFRVLVPSAR